MYRAKGTAWQKGKLKIKNKKLFQNVLTTVFINAIIKTVDKEEYFYEKSTKKIILCFIARQLRTT